MSIRDDVVGREEFLPIDFHACGFLIVADNLRHLATCPHLSAIALQGVDERLSHLVAASHNTEGTLVVEVHDEGMGGKGCLVFLCSIQRQTAHQDLGQFRICNDAVDDLIDGAQLVFRVDGSITLSMFQGVERGGSCHLLHEVEIVHQVVVLMREILRHLTDEGLTTLCKTIAMSVERHHLIAIGIEG